MLLEWFGPEFDTFGFCGPEVGVFDFLELKVAVFDSSLAEICCLGRNLLILNRKWEFR
jgi:hypothetical protein